MIGSSVAGSPSRSETTNVTGRGVAAERLVEWLVRLPQREVKRGAVKRPAPVEPRDVALGRDREQVERVDQLAELAERVAAREVVDRARRLQRDLVDAVVDDVLADALWPPPCRWTTVDSRSKPLETSARRPSSE